MNRFAAACGLAVAVCLCPAGLTPARADAPQWPLKLDIQGHSVVFFQPQVIAWQNNAKLTGRLACGITVPGAAKPVYGVLNFSADTNADFTQGTVVISNVQLTSVNFPNLSPDQQAQLQQFILTNERFPNRVVPLSAIQIGLKQNANAARTIQLNTSPPIIEYSSTPAILVVFDGDPLFNPVKGVGDLAFAVNTNWSIFRTGNASYLLDGSSWLRSDAITGPWKAATSLPAALHQLPNDLNWSRVLAALNSAPMSASQVPKVWVTTRPAEAIVTAGAPKLAAIAGTQLAYVSNTSAALFFDAAGKQYYYLTSGRWFAASGLNGPWTFANDQLPADFSRIPAGSARGWVLASVPGSAQAQTALLAADVPHSASANRASASLIVTYAGDPVLKPIEGTSLQYVANTSYDVINVGSQYYACNNGIWYSAAAANGPWKLADKVPDSIYTIPSTSPLYPDTYVTVDNADANQVTYSYTSGYLLGYALNGAYYYGTGWWAAPYISIAGGNSVYYAWPSTYLGGMYYNPLTAAWARGYRGDSVYGPYGGIGHAGVYDPVSRYYRTGAGAWGPSGIANDMNAYGTRTYQNSYYTGSSAGRTPYEMAGPGVTPRSYSPASGAAWHPNANPADIYAGSDGNVYRPTGGGQWQRYDNNTTSWHAAGAGLSGPVPDSELTHAAYARSGGFGGGGGFHGR